jgi:hypothetical protein
MRAVQYIIGIIGGVVPLLLLAARAFLAPAHDPVTRLKATETVYKKFTWIGVLLSVWLGLFVLMLIQSGLNEWMLGLYIGWDIFLCPFLALLLIPIMYGLYDSINAQRDIEFVFIALHTSVFYIVSFILMFTYGTMPLLLIVYLPIVIFYPIVCVWLSRNGKKKLNASI